MKKIIQIGGLLILALLISGCRSGRWFNVQKSSNKIKQMEESLSKSSILETLEISEKLYLKDSAQSRFWVQIFPLDSFRYSMDRGYEGKASKIEIYGDQSLLKSISSLINTERTVDQVSQLSEKRDISISTKSREKIVQTKTKWHAILWVLLGLFSVTFVYRMRYFSSKK